MPVRTAPQCKTRKPTDPAVAAVVPRWEWRIFRPTLPWPAEAVPHADGDVEASADTYLLASGSSFNVKIRRGRLEIKRLERMDEHGLEQWRPIHAFQFPLTPDQVATTCVDLGVCAPDVDTPIDVEAFLHVMRDKVRVVPVVKRRVRFKLRGCRGEHATLIVDGERWMTIAIEHQDSRHLQQAVESLGYHTSANIRYPRALKVICGLARVS